MMGTPCTANKLGSSSARAGALSGFLHTFTIVSCIASENKAGDREFFVVELYLPNVSSHCFPELFLSCSGLRVQRPAAQIRRHTITSYNNPITCMGATMQFVQGVNEPSVPEVKLTRSKDGGSGVATFSFTDPSVFTASNELGDITGLYMIDDEGTLQTVDVQAKFINGKPERIEAKYVMRTAFEWDRFMRFMERYAEENQLGFSKVSILELS